jgi:hypothetical protein
MTQAKSLSVYSRNRRGVNASLLTQAVVGVNPPEDEGKTADMLI